MAQFSPFSTSIAPNFWHSLTKIKLQILKLSDESIPIHGSFTKGRTTVDRQTGQKIGFGDIFELDGNAFEALQ